MPGFLAMLLVDRRERTGAAVLANTSAGVAPDTLALDLAEAALETLVRTPDAVAARRRRSGRRRAAPRSVVVGGLRARRALEGRAPRDRAAGRPAGAQRLVARRRRPRTAGGVVEGRELGEQLRVVRDEAGEPVRLYFATYPLTRSPAAFADVIR